MTTYPNKPVRIILPFAPGGGAAGTLRIFSDKLRKDMGQEVVIDNRPGGRTVIATEVVAHSAPDGHTVLVTTPTIAINHWVQPKLPYDTLKNLVAVATMVRNHHMIVVHPSVPADNLKELIAYARENPGKLKATVHPNANGNLGTRLFMKLAGVQITLVESRGEGGGATHAALLAGETQVSLNTPSAYIADLKAGRLKSIAISGDERNPALPDVPTFAEAGLPEFATSNWYILFAPSTTPGSILEKLNAHVRSALASADVRALLAKEGVTPFSNGLAASDAFFRAEVQRFGEAVKQE